MVRLLAPSFPRPPLFVTNRLHTYPCSAPADLRNRGRPTRRHRRAFFEVCAADSSQTAVTAAQEEKREDFDYQSACSGADVVRQFYSGVNNRNLSSVVDLIARDCVYEDLVFPKPFVGREAILEFFDKFMNTISKDLQFAIDDISEEDSSAIGVTWHLEWKGKEFPFSKGCSFYRLDVIDGKRQIIYGRDVVEPFIKPGDAALRKQHGPRFA
uniref:SnoaL-like domain-containing protein n=1 Tax=Kalanchoe fedtschenkoi TaxID=63787 RepID=A0A7N0U7B7_KALFE